MEKVKKIRLVEDINEPEEGDIIYCEYYEENNKEPERYAGVFSCFFDGNLQMVVNGTDVKLPADKVALYILREEHPKEQEFMEYLENTLIPDLRNSGNDATADDFETAIQWIRK